MRQTWTTARVRIKKDAYAYLDLKVTATPDSVDIKDYVQRQLLTTGQTWACLSSHAHKYLLPFALSIKG